MNTVADWIAAHALLLWTLLPLLAVLAGDQVWRRSARRRMATVADDRQPDVMQSRTTATLGVLAALLFAAIAFAIGTGEPGALVRFDTALAADMHTQLPPSALPVLSTVSLLGGTPWVVTLSTLMLLILLLRRQWSLSACWAIAQIGILPIAYGIKACFQRTRPPHDTRFVTDVGWSFPSGHAISSAVFYGMLAYVLLRLLPSHWHRLVIAAALLLAGLIGISRILLQAHYFSDVVAGYAERAGAATAGSVAGLLAYLDAAEAVENGLPPAPTVVARDRVQVLTVHSAKGLEWQVVAVAHLSGGIFPSTASRSTWLTDATELPPLLRGDRAATGALGIPVLDISDVTKMVSGIAGLRTVERDQVERLVGIALDGLRPAA